MIFCNKSSEKFVVKMLFLAGILTICTSILTAYMGKDQVTLDSKSKFSFPIYELELATSKSDVLSVIGYSKSEKELKNRKAINLQTYYDAYLVFSFSTYFALIFLFFYRFNTGLPFKEMMFATGLALSFMIFLSDIVENTQILKLISSFSYDNISDKTLTSLMISSRIKFAAVFISSMIIAFNYLVYCRRKKNLTIKTALTAVSVLYMITGISGFFSITVKNFNYLVETSIILLIICCVLTFMHTIFLILTEKINTK